MSTGWTWDYIDNEMTLLRLKVMNDYWNQFPPMHVMLAGFLGVKGKERANQQQEGSMEDLIAFLGGVT